MKEKKLLVFLCAGTILLLLIMRWHSGELAKSPLTKAGIVSLELAKTKSNADAIIKEWRSNAQNLQQHAIRNTYIDFIFILFYSLFLYAACYTISLYQTKRLAAISRIISLLALTAGFLDVIENYLLLQMLQHPFGETIPLATFYIAAVKFLFVGIAVLWLLILLLFYFIKKITTSAKG